MQESHLITGIGEHNKLLVKVVRYTYLLVLMKQIIFIINLLIVSVIILLNPENTINKSSWQQANTSGCKLLVPDCKKF